MRFFITGDKAREEVIGEEVVIEQAPNEKFAVHRGHVGAPDSEPIFAVTHVDTGLRVAGGDSIDFAIELARRTFASKTAEEIERAFKAGRERHEEAVRTLPIGPFPASDEDESDDE
ncbi:hypothetical protein [Paraburkholderia sp. 22B1P]|uniref:hypothetical protein n=1 Tax=Paraburkholderia sp. 22B1P TaxID=3080498 RepID=UPI00308BD6CA|nr:hypothetical protein PBP221_17480 [Paraburkholderia sp. 22B1P]